MVIWGFSSTDCASPSSPRWPRLPRLFSAVHQWKLAAEGHAERPGFVEALTEPLLDRVTELLNWDDGSGDDVIITFTDADTKKLDELTKDVRLDATNIVTQTSSKTAKAILKALKRDWSRQAEFERESLQGFRRRLEARWGKGSDGLRCCYDGAGDGRGGPHPSAQVSFQQEPGYTLHPSAPSHASLPVTQRSSPL